MCLEIRALQISATNVEGGEFQQTCRNDNLFADDCLRRWAELAGVCVVWFDKALCNERFYSVKRRASRCVLTWIAKGEEGGIRSGSACASIWRP